MIPLFNMEVTGPIVHPRTTNINQENFSSHLQDGYRYLGMFAMSRSMQTVRHDKWLGAAQ